jgi:hypothetical protein
MLLAFGLIAVLFAAMPMAAFAETVAQDGISIELTTETYAHNSGDTVKPILTVTNTNEFAVSNLELTHYMPEEFAIQNGSETNTIFSLKAGESKTFKLEYVKDNSILGKLPNTGDPMNLQFYIITCVLIAMASIFIIISKKSKKNNDVKKSSIFTTVTMTVLFSVLVLTSVPSVQSFAAEHAPEQKSFSVNNTFVYDNKTYTHTLTATYDFNSPIPTPQEQAPVTGLKASTDLPLVYGESKTITLGGGSGTGAYTLTSTDEDIVISGSTGASHNVFTVTNYNPSGIVYPLTAGRIGDANYNPATPVVRNSETTVVKELTLVSTDWAGVDGSPTNFDYNYTGESFTPKASVDTGVTGAPNGQPTGTIDLSISGSASTIGAHTATASVGLLFQNYFSITGVTTHDFDISAAKIVIQFDQDGIADVCNKWVGEEVFYSLTGAHTASGYLLDDTHNPVVNLTVSAGDILTLTEKTPNSSFRSWRDSNYIPITDLYAHIVSMPPMNTFTTTNVGDVAGDYFFDSFCSGRITSLPDGSFDTSDITSTGKNFFSRFNSSGKLSNLPAGSFDTSNIVTTDDEFFKSFNSNGELASLPEGSFDISNISTIGDSFFESFNYNGSSLTSLPESSFNTSNIVKTGDFFFSAFNENGVLTELPTGSFDTSNIKETGMGFFALFNNYGSLESLPAGSFDTSNIITTSSSYFYGFNYDGNLPKVVGGNPKNVSGGEVDAYYYPAITTAIPIANGSQMGYVATATATTAVTLDNSGGGPDSNTTAVYDTIPINVIPPTKAGYSFEGYYTDNTVYAVQIFDSSGAVQSNVVGYTGHSGKWAYTGATLTLYAKWVLLSTS